jgi:hypothetical protein
MKLQKLASQESRGSPFWCRQLSLLVIFSLTRQRQRAMAIFVTRFITSPARSIWPGVCRSAAADRFHCVDCSSHFRSFAPCPAVVAGFGGGRSHHFDGGVRARAWSEQIRHRTRRGAGCYASRLVCKRSPIRHERLRAAVLDRLRVRRGAHDSYKQS